MIDKNRQDRSTRAPAGFTPKSSGLAGEYAREQGWGLNLEERTKSAAAKQDFDGGTDYDYGARDFGDSAVDTSSAKSHLRPSRSTSLPAQQVKSTSSSVQSNTVRTATKKNPQSHSHSR